MLRDGRWFWWVAAACLCVLTADLTEVGPFAPGEGDPQVEVLGESVERTLASTTTTTTTTTTRPPTTVQEDDGLEGLEGFTPEELEALEQLVTAEASGG